jgi:hypothetical protein
MSLLDECIQSLGKNIKVLSTVETGQIFSMFEDKFAISPWGRIKWEEVDFKIHLESASQIIQSLNQYFSLNKLRESIFSGMKVHYLLSRLHFTKLLI